MKKLLSLLIFIAIFQSLAGEKIFFSADGMSGQAGNKSSTIVLEGEAFVQTESMEIQADSIELSGDNYSQIKASGKVSGKDLKSNMEFNCDQLVYNRLTKIASLQGNVSLKDPQNDVSAKAQIIEYNQNTDIAILQIQISLSQKENVCTGSYALYMKNQKLLELSGNAQITQNKDTFRAQHISLNMETQEITLDGNVRGSVTESKGEKSESKGEKSDER